ncbi:MAG: CHAT domain-containing protein, partial [Bacteroidota bacterium]|nr:CHAT domain-containing protein [Bacteroidota bacterium]
LSAERLTTLIVTQDTVECSQQPLPPNFRTQVQTYIQAIREAEGNQQVPYSHALFKLLFATPLNKNITRLLIIPDDELLYLPFETLRNKQGDYLVQQYTVQYQYATSLLKKQTVKLSGEPTLAMAPFTQQEWHSKKDTFRVLPYSAKELEGSRGKKLLHSAATKKAFLENLTQYTVLHLATHARAGNAPGTSYIAFYPESDTALQALLFTEEIYHLPLGHTKLAILSACETGWGNLVKGEGLMSLSRAFRYAGCENIITSLWKADDFSTAWLMQKLTAYLEKGYAVDAAVQKAKVDYLRDATIHPRLKHPYYWAHLVFIGNFEPQSSSGVLYAVLVIAICFPLLLFFLWQKRKKNGPLLYKQ